MHLSLAKSNLVLDYWFLSKQMMQDAVASNISTKKMKFYHILELKNIVHTIILHFRVISWY